MTTRKHLIAGLVVAVLAAAMLAVVLEEAHAAGGGTSNLDKGMAEKRGIAGSLASGSKDEDEETGPTKLQMALGVGSIFVMIAVVKWL